jgi:hypothetical protein
VVGILHTRAGRLRARPGALGWVGASSPGAVLRASRGRVAARNTEQKRGKEDGGKGEKVKCRGGGG